MASRYIGIESQKVQFKKMKSRKVQFSIIIIYNINSYKTRYTKKVQSKRCNQHEHEVSNLNYIKFVVRSYPLNYWRFNAAFRASILCC
jgi:hypothetical protein